MQPQGPINSPSYLSQGPHIYRGPQIHMPIYPNPIPLGYILIYTYPYIRAEIVMHHGPKMRLSVFGNLKNYFQFHIFFGHLKFTFLENLRSSYVDIFKFRYELIFHPRWGYEPACIQDTNMKQFIFLARL